MGETRAYVGHTPWCGGLEMQCRHTHGRKGALSKLIPCSSFFKVVPSGQLSPMEERVRGVRRKAMETPETSACVTTRAHVFDRCGQSAFAFQHGVGGGCSSSFQKRAARGRRASKEHNMGQAFRWVHAHVFVPRGCILLCGGCLRCPRVLPMSFSSPRPPAKLTRPGRLGATPTPASRRAATAKTRGLHCWQRLPFPPLLRGPQSCQTRRLCVFGGIVG